MSNRHVATDVGRIPTHFLRAPHAVSPSRPGTPRVSMASLLALALDETDYGAVILDDSQHVLYANHQARSELIAPHALLLQGEELQAQRPMDQRALDEAFHAASHRGIRRLISLGEHAQQVSLSVVPLSPEGDWQAPAVLLMIGRSQLCPNLSVQGFAKLHRLSPVEEQVLQGLCQSISPSDIAQRHGVALSTIRTQISNIRVKTCTDSIRSLVHHISMLPPLIGALRRTNSPPQS